MQVIDFKWLNFDYSSSRRSTVALTQPAFYMVEHKTYSDNLCLNEYDKTMVTPSAKPYAVYH